MTVSWPWSFAQQMIILPNSSQYQSAPSSLHEQRKISGNRNLQNFMLRSMPQSQTHNLDAETLTPIDQWVVESSTMFWSCLSLWLKYSRVDGKSVFHALRSCVPAISRQKNMIRASKISWRELWHLREAFPQRRYATEAPISMPICDTFQES